MTTGVSDGQFTELISGDVTQGMTLITNIMLPQVARPQGQGGSNPFMQGQPGNRGGGMMPGMGGGGPGGGGGGGGRGGGGGGGGRGGN